MLSWLYKWLPIIFGCHCLSERSFFYKGRQFPICARCTGELIGIFIGLIGWWLIQLPFYYYLLMLIPLVLDGTIQMFTKYHSSNTKRLLTGILFGYGFITLFIMSYVLCFNIGFKYGLSLRQK